MLTLTNVEKHITLSCEIIGYQFPDSLTDNWCMLKINVSQGDKVFEKIDPALDSRELIAIQHWFKALADKRLPRFAHLTFTEPCLSFEYLACRDDNVRLSINLSHELKPSFEIEQFKSSSKDWRIVFELDDNGFTEALSSLERSIERYPSRGNFQ